MKKTLALLFVLALFAVPALADEVVEPTVGDDGPAVEVQDELSLEEALETPEPMPATCQGGTGGRCICPQIYAPVCGCNGVTYVNSCYASCKVSSWTSGSCDGSATF